MIDPRSYILEQPDAVSSAFQGFGQGVQTVSYFQQQEIAKEKAIFERKQREQMQKDLSEVASNPTYEGYSRLQTLYPSIAENLSKARDTMTEGQQRQATSTAMQGTMLLGAGDVEGAKKLIESRAMAYENAGDIDTANAYRSQAKMIDANPNGAKESLMLIAANGLDPKELPKFFGDLGAERRAEQKLQPEIDKLEAETGRIEEETQWIPQLNQATIDNIDSQIDDRVVGRAIENKKVEAQNSQFYAGLDQTQKQFLMKLDQDERKLSYDMNPNKPEKSAEKLTRLEKVSGYETAVHDAGSTAKLAESLAKDWDMIKESTGGYWNLAMSKIPGTDEHLFSERLETLKSQVFLTQISKMSGMGALTNQEGERLEKAFASIKSTLDPKEIRKNLKIIATEAKVAEKKSQRLAEMYATRGVGYSQAVTDAAKQRGVTPYEMQKIANEMGN